MALLDTIGSLFTKALPWVTAGVSVLSTVKAYDSASQVEKEGRINAAIDRRDALAYWKAYEDRAAILRDEQRRFSATQRTAYAKSGVTMDGTPMDVLNDIAYQQNLDLAAMRSQAQADWQKFHTSANQTEWQGYQQGSTIRTQAISNLGNTLLTSPLLARTEKSSSKATTPPAPRSVARAAANAVPGARGWRPMRGFS